MSKQEERENIFHERTTILKKHGYRGFTVQRVVRKWGGVKVTAKNNEGQVITASGETTEEAYKKIIDNVDLALDEPR